MIAKFAACFRDQRKVARLLPSGCVASRHAARERCAVRVRWKSGIAAQCS
jgi:hypothetical protein